MIVLAACAGADATAGEGILAELGALGLERSIAPRVSVAVRHRPCAPESPGDGTVPRVRCGAAAASPAAIALSGRVAGAAETLSPDTLRAVALLDLLWGDEGGNAADRSISLLETASRLAEQPAPALADLSAAYLVRAERRQTPRDLLEALEAAERSLELDTVGVVARFNRALALDRLMLIDQATLAWEAYLRLDPSGPWAREARDRLRALASVAEVPLPDPEPGASAESIARFVRANPQRAREFGMDRALAQWAADHLRGDSARADGWLRLAERVGAALEAGGGDLALIDAVRAVRTADAAAARTRLAEAHAAYAGARARYIAGDFAGARTGFGRVRIGAASPVLSVAARVGRAAVLVHAGQRELADAELDRLARQVDAVRYPGLAAAVRSAGATARFRAGEYEQSLALARGAARLLERSGEAEARGGMLNVAAASEFHLGNQAAGYHTAHRTLTILAPFRASPWLHNQLLSVSSAAADDGLLRGALALQDEGVAAAARQDALTHAEARLRRSLLRSAAGRGRGAREDAAEAEALFPRIGIPGAVDWLRVDLRLARARTLLHERSAEAAAALDSVLDGDPGNAQRLVAALGLRAEARLTRGQVEEAAADLDQAAAVLAGQEERLGSPFLRASLLDTGERLFSRQVALRLAAGDPHGALRALERGRAAVARRGGEWSAPPGVAGVEYAIVGDTLVMWTLRGQDLQVVRRTIDRERLDRTIERARSALELRADADGALRELHDLMVGSLAGRLHGAEELVVVADGPLLAVPFAGLRGPDGRFLVEHHSIRLAGSLAGLTRLRAARPDRAVFVASPAGLQGYAPLQGADEEARLAAAGYNRSRMLRGRSASADSVRAAIAGADVLHLATHAVFDDQRPEHSFVVLTGGERLTAADLAGMAMGRLRLVVLSACETLPSRSGRSGGFAGFTQALLSAGAGGVVGSAWRVDDQLTRALMVEFHGEYRSSGNPAAALRAAQLRLLRSQDPALRSPAAWAGFRYAGN